MNDGKDDAPAVREWSVGWVVTKLLLIFAAFGVLSVAFLLVLVAVINMSDTCPRGLHVGHIPCDASIMIALIGLLIGAPGICLLWWTSRLETSVMRWRERLGRWRSAFAPTAGSESEKSTP
jgi:hypothetical protein